MKALVVIMGGLAIGLGSLYSDSKRAWGRAIGVAFVIAIATLPWWLPLVFTPHESWPGDAAWGMFAWAYAVVANERCNRQKDRLDEATDALREERRRVRDAEREIGAMQRRRGREGVGR